MSLTFRKTPSTVEVLLAEIVLELKGIRMNTDKLGPAVSKLANDFSKVKDDVTAFLQNQATPQNQADVDNAVAALGTIDQAVQNLDAAVNPPAPAPPAPPAAPTV